MQKKSDFKYIFGPVISRRLGISLGIDIVPPKTCSMNCIYCEAGKTTLLTTERKEFFPITEIKKEIRNFLSQQPEVDFLTFSGSGEPTLYVKLGQLIDWIKQEYPSQKICLLTNGILIGYNQMPQELKNLDLIIPSPELYRKIHPHDHSFEKRVNAIKTLKKIGYQTGTGVMIGIPGQKIEDLADDILFFKEVDADMIGMGPYIPHNETPMGKEISGYNSEKQLELALKMIVVTRIFLKDVNIASTTALQALKVNGRELGLIAGANIIMPNLTETKYRPSYKLYDGKPCIDENSSMCKACLKRRIESIGETIGFGEWGDSPHAKKNMIQDKSILT